jgi:hypothetical protein
MPHTFWAQGKKYNEFECGSKVEVGVYYATSGEKLCNIYVTVDEWRELYESPKPYKTKQIAARAAETSTKFIKPKKTAKLSATSPKTIQIQTKRSETRPRPAQNT